MADDLVQGSANKDARAKSGPRPVFANKVVLEQLHSSIYVLSMVGFALQWQSGVVASRDWSTKQKIFTIWPFMEKVGGVGGMGNCGLKKRKIRQEKANTRFKLLGFHSGSIMS